MQVPQDLGPSFTTLFDLYKHATTSVNGFWTFFSAASAATVALAFTGKATIPGRGKVALAIAYAAFALMNNYQVWHAQRLAYEAARLVRSTRSSPHDPDLQRVLSLIDPTDPWLLSTGHAAIMAAVLMGIYLAHRRDQELA